MAQNELYVERGQQPAFVGVGIGPFRGAQQRQAEDIPLGIVSIFAVVKQAEAMSRIGNVCPAQRRHFKFGLLGRRFAGGGTLDRTVRDFECSLLVVGAEREYSGTRLPFLCNMRPHRRVLWGRLAERPPAVHGVAVEQRDQESCAWEGQALADRTPLPAEIA